MKKTKNELGEDVSKITIIVKKNCDADAAEIYVTGFLDLQKIDYARVGNSLFIKKIDQETKDQLEYDFFEYITKMRHYQITSIVIK